MFHFSCSTEVKLKEWKLSGCCLFYRDQGQVLPTDHIYTVPWSHKNTPMSQREGASTEGNLYDSWHHILMLDPHTISWPSGAKILISMADSHFRVNDNTSFKQVGWYHPDGFFFFFLPRNSCQIMAHGSSYESLPFTQGSVASTDNLAGYRLYVTPLSNTPFCLLELFVIYLSTYFF